MPTELAPSTIYKSLLKEPDLVGHLMDYASVLSPPDPGRVQEAEAIRDRLSVFGALLGRRVNTKEPANVIRRVAWTLSLISAALRRKQWECEHVKLADRPTIFLLTTGELGCLECQQTRIALPFEDDGHCDVCDKETTIFHEMTIQDLFAVYMGNMCEECFAAHDMVNGVHFSSLARSC